MPLPIARARTSCLMPLLHAAVAGTDDEEEEEKKKVRERWLAFCARKAWDRLGETRGCHDGEVWWEDATAEVREE